MWSVVISSLKFDNKSFWNYSKISVPKMCKIVVLLSLKWSNGLKKPKGLGAYKAFIPFLAAIAKIALIAIIVKIA